MALEKPLLSLSVKFWDFPATWWSEEETLFRFVTLEDMLKAGDTAPDFELPSQNGELVRLSDFRGQKNVVLFFYPKDDTPGCTKEACTFRDQYAEFIDHDTVVLGISSDSGDSHAQFAGKYSLPFPLLTDTGGKTRRAYQVSRTLGIIPGRATFVIDKEGTLKTVFVSQFQAEQHVRRALAAVAG